MRLLHEQADLHSLAWVVMPDHLHWLVELGPQPLATLMQRLKSRSAIAINKVESRGGRLWQKGFHDRALRSDEDLQSVARYIVANPLRAGLVRRIGDYPLWDAVWV
jgi:REP element-mobilizing transposase RayT